MIARRKWCLGFCSLMLLCTKSFANDGIDRYQKSNPNLFHLFPDPIDSRSGYQVLQADTEAGADGEIMFRWAQPHAIAAVRIAAYETHRLLGRAKVPMTLFDSSSENGDTPIQWEPGKPGRGRHPGGSHDGGLNLDVGYFLTSLRGAQYNPDHAACTDHFEKVSGGKNQEANICTGLPDRLDVERQSMFFLQLFRINREQFESDLLEEVGIDLQVRRAVMLTLHQWANEGRHAASRDLILDMERTFVSGRWDGWAKSHHHHAHLRLRDLALYGHHRQALERLLEQERKIDTEQLCGKEPGQFPALRARLISYGLQRTIQAELVPDQPDLKQVRFRINDGEWNVPDPSLPYQRTMIDLVSGPRKADEHLKLAAEIVYANGKQKTLTTELRLPRQDPRLFVAINPSRITVDANKVLEYWIFKLQVPEPYLHYITSVEYEVFRDDKATSPERLIAAQPTAEVKMMDSGQSGISLARVKLMLSGRKELWFPVIVHP